MELWIKICAWQMRSGHRFFRYQIEKILLETSLLPESEVLRWLAAVDPFFLQPFDQDQPFLSIRDMERWQSLGGHFLIYGRQGYPRCLTESIDPPLTLSLWGGPEVLHQPGLAVVGSREPSPASLEWMEQELRVFCRQSGAVIVSGGARGIDQKAHAVALRAGCPTVIFLPSGLDQIYPSDLQSWSRAVLEGGGAFVSEYPFGMAMRKAHFHHRNRLIAAAAKMVLIVEARAKGGTLLTAARAAEMGRPLMVVPAHPTEPRFAGNIALLAEGSTLVRHAEDLVLFWQAEQVGNLCGPTGIGQMGYLKN